MMSHVTKGKKEDYRKNCVWLNWQINYFPTTDTFCNVKFSRQINYIWTHFWAEKCTERTNKSELADFPSMSQPFSQFIVINSNRFHTIMKYIAKVRFTWTIWQFDESSDQQVQLSNNVSDQFCVCDNRVVCVKRYSCCKRCVLFSFLKEAALRRGAY